VRVERVVMVSGDTNSKQHLREGGACGTEL